ncbi:MAG: hypothetical protein JWQ35_152 [Bacteriovoracaceae bacterium]|nr:hypothetical protein [Bacteriovoracaceae bacterium]
MIDPNKSRKLSLYFKIVTSDTDREKIKLFLNANVSQNLRQSTSLFDDTGIVAVLFEELEVIGVAKISFSKDIVLQNSELYDFERFEKLYPGRVAFLTKPIIKSDHRWESRFLLFMKEIYKIIRTAGMEVTVVEGGEAAGDFKEIGFHHYRYGSGDSQLKSVQPMVMYNRDEPYFEIIDSPLHELCCSFNKLEKLAKIEKNVRTIRSPLFRHFA